MNSPFNTGGEPSGTSEGCIMSPRSCPHTADTSYERRRETQFLGRNIQVSEIQTLCSPLVSPTAVPFQT